MATESKEKHSSCLLHDIMLSQLHDNVSVVTPLTKAQILSDYYVNSIHFKREDLQTCSTYKIRGIHNKIKLISTTYKKLVCATSTYVDVMAYVATKYDCELVIVVPKTVHHNQVSSWEKLGVVIVPYGDNYQEAIEYAKQYSESYYYIDLVNDMEIIAPAGVCALELIKQLDKRLDTIDAIFVPDHPDLVSCMAYVIKTLYPKIKTKIIMVCLRNNSSLHASLKDKRVTELKKIDTFVNSDTPSYIIEETLILCQKYVDGVVEVDIDGISRAVQEIYNDSNVLVDMSSATTVAGMTSYIDEGEFVNKNFVCVFGGGRLRFDKLKYISDRVDIGNNTIIKIVIPEEPCSLLNLLKFIINDSMGYSFNITQLRYRYNDKKEASLLLGFSMGTDIDTKLLTDYLATKYTTEEFNNSSITQHLMSLFGGFNGKLDKEYIFVITLPDRSGALMEVLKIIGTIINITMFHYQDRGDMQGNVLLGIQLLDTKYEDFVKTLDKITLITYTDVTDDNAFTLYK